MSLFAQIQNVPNMGISGPISMYVLNPTEDFLTENPYAPYLFYLVIIMEELKIFVMGIRLMITK